MLNTREKILTSAEAVSKCRGCVAFVAYFDILTGGLVRRIAEIGRPVVAVVCAPAVAILTAQARAELAAALGGVAAAVLIEGDPSEFLLQLQPVDIIDWRGEDARRTGALAEHVQSLYKT